MGMSVINLGNSPSGGIDDAWRTRMPPNWVQFGDGSWGPPNPASPIDQAWQTRIPSGGGPPDQTFSPPSGTTLNSTPGPDIMSPDYRPIRGPYSDAVIGDVANRIPGLLSGLGPYGLIGAGITAGGIAAQPGVQKTLEQGNPASSSWFGDTGGFNPSFWPFGGGAQAAPAPAPAPAGPPGYLNNTSAQPSPGLDRPSVYGPVWPPDSTAPAPGNVPLPPRRPPPGGAGRGRINPAAVNLGHYVPTTGNARGATYVRQPQDAPGTISLMGGRPITAANWGNAGQGIQNFFSGLFGGGGRTPVRGPLASVPAGRVPLPPVKPPDVAIAQAAEAQQRAAKHSGFA